MKKKINKKETIIYIVAIILSIFLFLVSSYIWLDVIYVKFPEKVLMIEFGYILSQVISIFAPGIVAVLINENK